MILGMIAAALVAAGVLAWGLLVFKPADDSRIAAQDAWLERIKAKEQETKRRGEAFIAEMRMKHGSEMRWVGNELEEKIGNRWVKCS